MLFFYFAGHGDENSIHLGNRQLSRKKLLRWIDGFPAQLRVVIIDSCQTVAGSRVRGVRAGDDFDIGIRTAPEQRGTVIISSSSKGEPAHESDTLKGAIFTHFMVSGLLGGADIDQDGRITLQEAFTYSYRNTVRHSARGSAVVQHPSFNFDIDGSGEIVLTEPSHSNAVLVLPAGKGDAYLVFKEVSGTVVAEVINSSSKRVHLAVPTGRLLVQRRVEGIFQLAEVNISYGGQHFVRESDFEDVPFEQTVTRGATRRPRHPNFISVEGVLLAQHIEQELIPTLGPRLRYARTLPNRWLFSPVGTMGFLRHQNELLETKQTILEWGVELGRRFPMGITDISVLAVPLLHVRWQKRTTALDEERLAAAGIQVEEVHNRSLGGGGSLRLRMRVPLPHRFSFVGSVEGGLISVQMTTNGKKEWTTVPTFGGAAGVGYLF